MKGKHREETYSTGKFTRRIRERKKDRLYKVKKKVLKERLDKWNKIVIEEMYK